PGRGGRGRPRRRRVGEETEIRTHRRGEELAAVVAQRFHYVAGAVQPWRPRVQPGEVELEIRGLQRHRGHVGPAADVDAQVDVAGAGGDVVQAEAQIGQGRDVGEQVIGA